MGHANELDAERADVDGPRLGLRLLELRGLEQPVLVQAGLGEAEGQACPPHLRDSDFPEQVRQRADVVLVRVREQHGSYAVTAVGEIRHVREDQVDAEVLVPREGEPGVDDDDLAVELVDGHVLADLADAAERNDPQSVPRHQRILRAPTRRRRSRAGFKGCGNEADSVAICRRCSPVRLLP